MGRERCCNRALKGPLDVSSPLKFRMDRKQDARQMNIKMVALLVSQIKLLTEHPTDLLTFPQN